MDAGLMPALRSLVERGTMGNIATLDPPFSPMLWTSVATGHTADRHGIVHFVQPTSDGSSAQPVLGSARRTKALWNILSQEGLRSNVIGWWPSHPAEPILGAMVSNFFHPASAPVSAPWVAPPGTVHPPELEEEVMRYRVHPAEMTANHLLPFLPNLSEIDQTKDGRPFNIAKILADASSVHAATTYLMAATEWDLTAVYYDAIDHFGHKYMRFHPPKMDAVSQEDFENYRHVIEAAYRFHDMMLERLLDLAGDDCTVVLLSDHGFHSDHLRPVDIPRVPGGPAVEHRPFGVFCIAGPGIKQDHRVYGASLLHVAPTILTLLGLPVGEDMAMRPLTDIFESPPTPEMIPSWEDVSGDDGMSRDGLATDPWSGREAMRQLVELGYVDPEGGTGATASAQAARDSAFNLGRVYLSTGRPHLAVAEFETAYYGEQGGLPYYGFWLVQAYSAVHRLDDAEALALELKMKDPSLAESLDALRAEVAILDKRPEDALELLKAHPVVSVETALRSATALLALDRFEEAERIYIKILDRDPDSARAHHGRAKVAIGEQRYDDAWDHALEAVSRLYHYPEAHYHLGVALARLGWLERAEQAFLVALNQNPRLTRAHQWLRWMYEGPLNQPERASRHKS